VGLDAGPPVDAGRGGAGALPAIDAGGGKGGVPRGNDAGLGSDAGVVLGTPIDAINDPVARDTDPSFTADLLELYFVSTRSGSKDLFRSLRASAEAEWGAPELVTELSFEGQDENPSVSADGLDLWFFTDRDRALGSIWHSTRSARNEPWSPPEPVTGLTLAEGGSDVSVAVDATGTRFVLNSKLPGPPPYGLYEFVFDPATGALAAPITLSEVNSTGDDFDPDLRQAGLFLAFDSARAGVRQIYWTRRQSLDEPFATPVALTEGVQTAESAVAFSEDLRYLMFSANVAGSSDIYERYLDAAP
jgi:Tol biopolymer transport system component